MTWLQFVLLWLACAVTGGIIGVTFARHQARRAPGRNDRYVRPKCLRAGHDWLRLDGVPFQFCHRWRCTGARVAPWVAAQWPADLVTEMEQVIDVNGDALSQDRRP